MKDNIKDTIIDKYSNEEKSILTIGRELSIPYWKVYKLLKLKNIKIRGGRWQSSEGRLKNSKLHNKFVKKDFSGNDNEKAYLLGFMMGDLHVRNVGFRIRVSCGSTHPSQIKLFIKCFKKYSRINKYPSINNNGYENCKYYWSLMAHLNQSFSFFSNKEIVLKDLANLSKNQFLYYIAGFFDAEGSCGISKYKQDRLGFFLSISNQKISFLEPISNFLNNLSIENHINFDSVRKMYMIKIRSKKAVFNFIELFQQFIKHSEKQRKFALLKKFKNAKKVSHITDLWNNLLNQINEEVKECVNSAKKSYIERHKYGV